eukprot:3223721-Alexandrium_andersonii.AAC.1
MTSLSATTRRYVPWATAGRKSLEERRRAAQRKSKGCHAKARLPDLSGRSCYVSEGAEVPGVRPGVH